MSLEGIPNDSADLKFDVLFVDDESRVLDGLRRQFRAQRSTWDMRFANSGAEALEMLSNNPADVVVSDMRMPGMSGAELLNQIRKAWPETVRFVLSGQTDQSELLQDIGCIHQFIQKPCDPDQLTRAISRTHTLSSSIESSALRRVVSGIQSLPIISQVYIRLVDAMNDERSDADSVAKIVEEDIGMSVKILQLVNSAFFGIPRKTVSVKDAVVLMGMQNLLQLVLSAQIFDTLSQDVVSKDIVSKLWIKSTQIGATAKSLAKDSGLPQSLYESACLAGSLSHIGRAILARTMPDEFTEIVTLAEQRQCSIREQEIETLGIGQELIGAYALGIWGFTDSLIETVAMQECPSKSIVTDREHQLFWLHFARSLHGSDTYIDSLELDSHWVEGLGFDEQQLNKMRSVA